MEYRRLGKSGLKLSALSFGSWVTFANQVDDRLAQDMLATAYERGVNFFDNAETYAQGESERIMGRVLNKLGWGRDSFCLSSKVFWGGDKPTQRGLCRKHIFDACHGAMKRLQVDYLDLYFCHRPDPETPIEETARAMHDLVCQGKVMYWGTSEWSAKQLNEAYDIGRKHGWVTPTMEQPQYSLVCRHRVEIEYRLLYDRMGLGTTIWSPLASGILTGKYRDGIQPGSRMTLPGFEWLRKGLESEEGKVKIETAIRLESIAAELGISLAELSLAWCLKNPNVSTVILGASRLEQLEQNLRALDVLPLLTPEIMKRIDAVAPNQPLGQRIKNNLKKAAKRS